MCPDWELNPQSFGYRKVLQPTKPTIARAKSFFRHWNRIVLLIGLIRSSRTFWTWVCLTQVYNNIESFPFAFGGSVNRFLNWFLHYFVPDAKVFSIFLSVSSVWAVSCICHWMCATEAISFSCKIFYWLSMWLMCQKKTFLASITLCG